MLYYLILLVLQTLSSYLNFEPLKAFVSYAGKAFGSSFLGGGRKSLFGSLFERIVHLCEEAIEAKS